MSERPQKMLKQWLFFKQNCTPKLFIAFKMAHYCCFGLGFPPNFFI